MMLQHDYSLARNGSTEMVDDVCIQHLLAAEQARAARRALQPPRYARLAARLFGAALDRALIEGADPAGSPRLAARAALLTSASMRGELADGLDQLVASAQVPPQQRRMLLRHSSVLSNASLLRELATTLRGSAPVYADGIAMLRRLLTDGTGPVYSRGDGPLLERELLKARAALTC